MNNTDQEHLDNFDRENIILSPLQKRISSFIIDDILMGIIIVISFWSIIKSTSNIEVIINTINQNIIYILLLKFSYHSFFIWYYGQTVGKMIMKIRAVDLSSLDNPSIVNACIRSSIRLMFEFLFYIGFLFFFISIIKQTLHDKLSKIIIINDN